MPVTAPEDAEIPPQPRSLADRLVERARTGGGRTAPASTIEWRLALAIAALVWLGPLATLLGAKLLAGAAQREAQALQAELAPRIAAQREAEEARRRLASALAGPRVGGTLEAVARTLPAEASLVRLAREPGGAIEIEAAAPDPDRLRTALRRAPEFAGLRDMDQRSDDGAMLSRFRVEVR